MTEGFPEGEQPVNPTTYTGPVARYVGKSAVVRGTEEPEWQVPAEETPTPTTEEEDSSPGGAESGPQSIEDFDS